MPKLLFCVSTFFLLALTGIYDEFKFLAPLHLESVFFVLAVGIAVFKGETTSTSRNLLLGALLLLIAPLISSFFYHGEEALLLDPEYPAWGKALLIASPLVLAFKSDKDRTRFLYLLGLAAGLASAIFLYHYKVLGEVREWDLRPLILTKNGDPNFMCTLFSFFLPLCWYASLKRKEFLVLIPVLFYCAFLTESRMGLLALFIAHIYLFSKVYKKHPRFVLGAVVVLALGAAVFGIYTTGFSRFAEMKDASNLDRIKTMKNGWQLFIENPFFGVGWGRAPLTYFENSSFPNFQTDHLRLEVHNTPIQVLAELGFMGFAAFAFIIGTVLQSVFRNRKQNPELFTASVAALLVLGLNSLTLPLQNKDFVLLALFAIAALNSSGENATIHEKKSP